MLIAGVEVQLYAFLTSALDGGEWSASCPGRFTPRERAPSTHLIRGWEEPVIPFRTPCKSIIRIVDMVILLKSKSFSFFQF
jgi:hypothetical protein